MTANKCDNCCYCKLLYSGNIHGMYESDYFYCTVKKKITDTQNSCGRWRKNFEQPLDLSHKRIRQIERDINYILEHITKT